MGVQSLDRAVGILTCLGHSGEQGMRLVDLQHALGLKRPTVHRILASLIEHGLVAYDESSRTYRLGWEAAVLGWSAVRGGYDLREVAQGAINRLAEESGETAVLCACSRLDLVCIDRKTGDYPIKVFTVEIGTRRPLGVGAGSIAVLATMTDDDALAVLDALQGSLQSYPEQLRRGIVPAMRAARKAGYAVSDGLVLPNVRGVGVAIRDPRGVAIGSMGVASIADRASDERVAEFAAMLLREQARIERALRDRTTVRAKTVAAPPRRPSPARDATVAER
jgi:DNA-binding IclR family transcriptional regulator